MSARAERVRHCLRGAPVGPVAALAASLIAARADAHEVGLSRGEYVVQGAEVRADLIFARKDLVALVAGVDADHDGALTPAELDAARGAIEGALVGRVHVKGDGAACPGAFEAAALAEQDGVSVRAVYRCPARPRRLDVELAFFDDLTFGHRHLAHAAAGAAETFAVISQRAPSLTLDVPPSASPPPLAGPSSTSPPLRRGALHALARGDIPAFLLALLLPCEGKREALRASLAFLAAAAAGLFLGARGLFVPSPGVLDPAIGISLLYAGLDLVTARAGEVRPLRGPARWHVAALGLVHGLGAAAALSAPAELAGFGTGLAAALAAEAGVIAAIAMWTRRRIPSLGRGALALGAAVAALGLYDLVAV